MGQDGHGGVFGQFWPVICLLGGEFRSTGPRQPSITPVVASDGWKFWRSGRVLWAGPAALIDGPALCRRSQPPPAPAAFVSTLSQSNERDLAR